MNCYSRPTSKGVFRRGGPRTFPRRKKAYYKCLIARRVYIFRRGGVNQLEEFIYLHDILINSAFHPLGGSSISTLFYLTSN